MNEWSGPEQLQTISKYGSDTVSYRKRLEIHASELEKRAADIRIVLKHFEEHPEMEGFLDAIRRLGI